ncbi:MAG TPA: hypothetical protein VNK81_06060, partial [Thermodesulfobacteriota bacterium]|nr:hypothetical protein [Thermodesulfobacteriota bacterium]
SQSRALVSIDKKNINSLERMASKRGVPMEVIGEVGGDRLSIKGLIDVSMIRAYESWALGFENVLKSHA